MERSFIAVTAVASTLMFAGVWKATEPSAAAVPAVIMASEGPATPPLAPPVARTKVVASSVREVGPYNVVRSAYGSSQPARRASSPRGATPRADSSAYYGGCRAARAAGVTPLYRGEPGYRVEMDGDGDGIACEDYR